MSSSGFVPMPFSKRVEKEFLEPLDSDERRQLQGLLSKLACHLDTQSRRR